MSECRVVDLKELGVSKEVFDKIYSMGEEDGRTDAIDEFIKGCKATHDGLICNWDKPYGITFERMEEKAKELKERNNELV